MEMDQCGISFFFFFFIYLEAVPVEGVGPKFFFRHFFVYLIRIKGLRAFLGYDESRKSEEDLSSLSCHSS